MTTLRQKATKAVSISAAGFVGIQALRLASNLLLTRLLAPEYFGLMSLVGVFIYGLFMLTEGGLGSVGISHPEGNKPGFLRTLWVIEAFRGVFSCLLGLVVAGSLWAIGHFELLTLQGLYADPHIAPMLAVLSMTLVFSGLESQQKTVAKREMRNATLIGIDIGAQITSILAMVACAWITASVWSLVLGQVVLAMAKLILTYAVLGRLPPGQRFDRGYAIEIFRFGSWAFLSSLLTFLINSLDKLLLAVALSAVSMGKYAVAQTLSAALIAGVSTVIYQVMLPLLSKAHHAADGSMPRIYTRTKRLVNLLACGTAIVLFVSADAVVALLWDDRYRDVSLYIRILSFGILAVPSILTDQALVALSQTRLLSHLNAARLIMAAVLFVSLWQAFGPVGALIAIIATPVANALLTTWMTRKSLPMDAASEALLFGPFFLVVLVAHCFSNPSFLDRLLVQH